MTRAAIAIWCSLLTMPACAQGIVIKGTIDCGQWISAREQSSAGYLEHYVLGVLNGLAIGRFTEFWRAGGQPAPSRDAIYLWIDGYCRAHPLEDVFRAAGVLFNERSGWKPN